MAVTTSTVGRLLPWLYRGTDDVSGKKLDRHVETGAANAPLTVTVPADKARRLVLVTVKYSAAPTQAGVTTTLDSGAGASYDVVLNTGAANAQNTVYLPDGELMFGSDDAIVVVAPAGGAGITASVAVYTAGL